MKSQGRESPPARGRSTRTREKERPGALHPSTPNRLALAALGLLLSLMVACGPLPPVTTRTPQAPAARARWTIMLYVSADSDLEAHQMDDLKEIAAIGSTPKVQMVALVDRSPKDSGDEGYSDETLLNMKPWSGARLLHLEQSNVRLLEDWGSVNLADGAVLGRFLDQAFELYPAEHYALFLSGHGTGPEGALPDDSAEDEVDLLTMPEFTEQLEGRPRFDLIGYDACIMSNYEVAQALAPYAQVLVASQETEPEKGWDYTTPLARLQREPDMTALQLGALISSSYQRSFDLSIDPGVRKQGDEITMAVVRLDRMQALTRALDAFCAACEQSPQCLQALGKAREEAHQYAASDDPDEQFDLFDLGDLARRMADSGPDHPMREAATKLEQEIQAAVPYRVKGSDQADSSGLSVFFPEDPEILPNDPDYTSIPGLDPKAGWLHLLERYNQEEDSP